MTRKSALKEAVEKTFLAALQDAFGDNLVSVMIYGSYVGTDFVPGVSDVNILVLLEKSESRQAAALGAMAHRIMRKYRITPLILTRAEFRNSADVFPMEYLDIADKNWVLFGVDETKELSLKKKNLRHQLEERLRGSVASLRQVLVASRGRKRVLRVNMKMLFGSLKAIFKGLLRLKGLKEIPTEGQSIIDGVEESFSIPGDPFGRLLRFRSGERYDVEQLAGDVLRALQELITAVDGMKIRD
jgi:predicted nucleotidyltransferase